MSPESLAPAKQQAPAPRKAASASATSFALSMEALRRSPDPMLQLASLLQTTLDAEKILELFAQHLRAVIDYDSLDYGHEVEHLKFRVGRRARHSCTYRLDIPEHSLGELTLTRKRCFEPEDLQLLEQAICVLVYPLRNAILYTHALEASHRDALTGVNNRAAMDMMLAHQVRLAHRQGQPLSMIVLDIDHFKLINDTYGHAVGDCLIKTLAATIERNIRSSDMLFRYGGEEFVALLNNTDQKGAMLLAERIRKAVEKTVCECNEIALKLTISLGIATLSGDLTEKTLFSRADTALYRAKADGRNCVRVAEKIN